MKSIALKRTSQAGVLVIIALAAMVLFVFDPSSVPILPACVFHRLTGLDCPGCGTTRALHQLLHGHLNSALHFNAFFVVSLPLFAAIAGCFAWRQWHGQPMPRMRPFWLWCYFGAYLAFGILRNLPIPPFQDYAP